MSAVQSLPRADPGHPVPLPSCHQGHHQAWVALQRHFADVKVGAEEELPGRPWEGLPGRGKQRE